MLNGKCSGVKIVTSDVPQCSILGHILFMIYVNDIPECLQIFCKIFADDTKAVDKRSDKESLQQDLLKLSEWSRICLLEFSIQKCKLVQYGNVKYDFEYKLNAKMEICKLYLKTQNRRILAYGFKTT